MVESLRNHYSRDPEQPVYFRGGWLSSFDNRWPFAVSGSAWMGSFATFGYAQLTFPTREHWFAPHKTVDPKRFMEIKRAGGPFEAKVAGRDRKLTVLRPGWDEGISFDVMLAGIRLQLGEYVDLRRLLLGTGERLIAEDSLSDFIWGIRDASGGLGGQNLLGQAWMRAREELRS